MKEILFDLGLLTYGVFSFICAVYGIYEARKARKRFAALSQQIAAASRFQDQMGLNRFLILEARLRGLDEALTEGFGYSETRIGELRSLLAELQRSNTVLYDQCRRLERDVLRTEDLVVERYAHVAMKIQRFEKSLHEAL